VPGLVAVAGGKYTTYRVMARDAVDAVARGLEQAVPQSVTHITELVGAEGFAATWNQRARISDRSGLHVKRVEHLLWRYGSRTEELLALIGDDASLADPLEGAEDYLRVEVHYAASHEGALHLDDVLTRRTHISIETWDRGEKAAEPAARIMAAVLGWSTEDVEREVSHYRARVDAERRSQKEPEDRAADEVRTSAPDLLAGTPAA
jgi:glycerol-3-phosphate dehydrogenase